MPKYARLYVCKHNRLFCLHQRINIIIGLDLFSQPLSAAKVEAQYVLWQQKSVLVLDNFHQNSCIASMG